MVFNDALERNMAEYPDLATAMANLMPVPLLDTTDISNGVAWLVCDAARHVTAATLPIDAGFAIK